MKPSIPFCVVFLSVLASANVARAQPPGFRKPYAPPQTVVDGFTWIDAEDFRHYGGWKLDTQFVHLMGSGYLIAAGVGKPVKDATTALTVATPGVYRVWVRARNWIPAYAPGRFQLLIDGQPLDREFGAADADTWIWEDGGTVTLKPGQTAVALHDLTGYYGRCDAILLTRDQAYRPAETVAALTRERSRLTGLRLEPEDSGAFDVIVVGGGSAGCPAALAAARLGAKTVLIQNRPVLGGNSSEECGVGLNGAGNLHPRARETGIAEETGRVKAFYNYGYYGQAFLYLAERQENLTLCLNQHVFSVSMKDATHIAAVKSVDTLTGQVREFSGKTVIDCTGDGWIGYFAKADFRLGREAASEYDEDLAPEEADRITMSGCLMGGYLAFRSVDTGKPIPYERPAWAHQMKSRQEFGRRVRRVTGGEWWMEHPGTVDDIWGAEFARDELIRITYGYWDYIKNASELREEATTYALVDVPLMDAKRESRRLLGDYVLTQKDVQNETVFPDRISYGGWPIDVHHPEGIFSGTPGPFDCNPHVKMYTIPYRCLYSRNIDNLLFAGRCASVTHIALGSVRVQSTLATLGQAAGTAAALCVRHSTTPRGIYQDHLVELQQTLLKHDQTIPELRNEDPADLTHMATVTASSTADFTEFAKTQVEQGDAHPLNMCRGMVLPATDQPRIDDLFLCLETDRTEPTSITLHLGQTDDESRVWDSGQSVATTVAEVPPGRRSWVRFPVNQVIRSRFLWFYLPATEGIHWRLMRTGPHGTYRGYGGSRGWTPVAGQYYAFYCEPQLRKVNDYGAANLTNGKKRDWKGETNMWMSNPGRPMPQWVELAFPRPFTVNSVYITFDTDQGPGIHRISRPRTCVRDYELAYYDGRGWIRLFEEEGNFQRLRIHRFDRVKAEKLRLTVTATNGDPSARIFEVRVYNE